MVVEVQVIIYRSRSAVWNAISNIEKAAEIISGIQKIEIVEKPVKGIVGLKWRETRMYFGKPATVEIWITDAVENQFYKTRAESDGYLFLSTMSITESSNGSTLISSHDYKPQSIVAKFKAITMFLFKGMIKKILLQDLNDIKSAVERER